MTTTATPSPLAETFADLRREGSGALITYFPIGIGVDAVELAAVYDDSGVDVLESSARLVRYGVINTLTTRSSTL